MSRVLKFRAWDHVDNVMLFADIYEMQDINGEWTAWDLPVDSPTNTGTPFEIMQFTGLQDKNGVDDVYEHDLFEGEVLMGHPEKGSMHGGSYWVKCLLKIEFVGVAFVGVAVKQLSDLNMNFKVDGMIINLPSKLSVIGNVHESPELLNQ